eukprot:2125231-Amphidinium_carterae.1
MNGCIANSEFMWRSVSTLASKLALPIVVISGLVWGPFWARIGVFSFWVNLGKGLSAINACLTSSRSPVQSWLVVLKICIKMRPAYDIIVEPGVLFLL